MLSSPAPEPGRLTTGRAGRLARFTVFSLLLVALAAALLAGPMARPARAEGTASSVDVQAQLGFDGVLKVTEKIVFTGSVPAEVKQRFELRDPLPQEPDRERVQQVNGFAAKAGGQGVTPTEVRDSRSVTVTMPTNGATELELTYQVSGAVITADYGTTALSVRLLQGLSLQVTEFNATVAIPAPLANIDCTAGPPGSDVTCDFAAGGTHDAPNPTFRDGPRGENEEVAIRIDFPADAVPSNEVIETRWTLGRAFSVGPLQLGIALALLVLGGIVLFALHRLAGADARPGGQIAKIGEFAPVGDGESEFRVVGEIRPGQVGTVVDERVDPIDVTASLIDLAVRGHLLITELPRESEFARTDWVLSRPKEADPSELHPFEIELLDGLAAPGGEVRVSELSDKVRASIDGVQDKLYDEMVANGWYERRPDSTRNRWTQLALAGLIVAVVATGLLAAFTTFGLIGLALVILGLGLVFVAQEMPARTGKGSAVQAGLMALRSDLLSQPTDQMPAGQELRELSEVLPYAVVLGGAERWLDAIVASDADEDPDSTDLSWYHGPDNWHLRDLPDSLRNFIGTVAGNLFTR
ncbi:DUF2207 domain-containing protein [Microlunatus speluncae]|uniref:DUF2207 domain-containing protein n=1 Tax=Microlunatus speluncae TaxID=2594267 RepID=UPI0012666B23|nr:DUF2207 domain-containing protein [Microlunatus speluncae]